MNVDVDKLKDQFLLRVEDRYNQDMFFVESCMAKDSKFSRRTRIKDISLHIYFEKNNFVIINGKSYPYCVKNDGIRKIKLINLSKHDTPDIKIIKKIEDSWDKSDW